MKRMFQNEVRVYMAEKICNMDGQSKSSKAIVESLECPQNKTRTGKDSTALTRSGTPSLHALLSNAKWHDTQKLLNQS